MRGRPVRGSHSAGLSRRKDMTNQDTIAANQVVVVGAGYAGLRAALQLAPFVQVTLVAPDDHFTERVRLHEKAAGRPDVTHSLRTILRDTGVTHVAALVTRIDTAAAEAHTDAGHVLRYDRLVYALGSRTGGIGLTGTAEQRAFSAESAAELYKRLRDGSGSLTVVGGGPTGVELATELAESHPGWTVGLVTGGEIVPSVGAKGRAHVRSALLDRRVRVEEGRHVGGPDEIDADVVVWAGSMVPNTELAVAAGIATDSRNQISVDPALRSLSHPHIYATGDTAAVETPAAGRIRMACATALPLGAHAALSVVRDLRGQEPKPFTFGYAAQCISLGRHDALFQLVAKDDSPRTRVLTGRPGALVKEQIVRTTVRTIRLDARHPRVARHIPGSN